jgi:Rieske Fe-S protein
MPFRYPVISLKFPPLSYSFSQTGPVLTYSSSISRAGFRSSTPRAMAQEYRLKDVGGLDLQDGEKREVEVDGIEGGKVLLAKINGKTHAMSANCTHYGAPLKNGVLTPDGRLTCPWHGGKS